MDKGDQICMISVQIRRYAVEVQANTGRSIQDTLRDFVAAARSGFIVFGEINCCTVCGSKSNRIIVTKRMDEETVRTHKCEFCNNVFRSVEKIIFHSPGLQKESKPIALKKKKPHIKNRKS